MSPISSTIDPVARFFAYARERHSVYLKRAAGAPSPWTDDPVLREYRFCNAYRELDTVTKWIADNWRAPHIDDPDLWFAMVVARFVNWPETLAGIGYPVPWRPKRFMEVMDARRSLGVKVYTGAYMVRANSGAPGQSKQEYQAEDVFSPLWMQRKSLRPKAGNTLNLYHMLLGQFHGLGSFMAAQVVADLKYVDPLYSAIDWNTFAASGPGSRMGLNFVLGRPPKAPWREDEWRMELERLLPRMRDFCLEHHMEPMHAQDVQNNLCEFSKYERARLGTGRPRARFRP